jgi:hypothetical protein
MRRSLLAVFALALAACSPGSFDGTVAGVKLDVKSAVFLQGKDSNGSPTSAWVALTDIDQPCDMLKANRTQKNGTYALFALEQFDSSHKVIAPGIAEYTVTDNLLTFSGNVAFASFTKNDTNCTNTLQSKNSTGRSGLIKVTSYKAAAGGSINGSFDVTYGDQNDRVTGGFNAPFCDADLPSNPNCE